MSFYIPVYEVSEFILNMFHLFNKKSFLIKIIHWDVYLQWVLLFTEGIKILSHYYFLCKYIYKRICNIVIMFCNLAYLLLIEMKIESFIKHSRKITEHLHMNPYDLSRSLQTLWCESPTLKIFSKNTIAPLLM